jgi:enoyl-CoA hydratase
MSYRTIRLSHESGVATLRLHRPERMNAVVEEMYREIGEALTRCGEDRGLRAVVLTGSALRRDGEVKQAFCAGADLKEHASGRRGPDARREYIRLAHETCRLLHEHPLPTVASVNGPARGAGAELALCCDFLLMAEEATLAFPETGLGTFVGGGVTYHLPRLVGTARAKELVYTGRVLDGREAEAMGLALRCVPLARLEEESGALAAALAARAPLSLRLAKKHLQAPGSRDLERALDEEAEGILACMETEDWREGILAFAERRPPVFRGK